MIRIVTDSAADITSTQALAMNVEVVYLTVRFPDAEYNQMGDEDFSKFYNLLTTTKSFPQTSQPSPDAFGKVFSAAMEAGDDVVAVLLSGRLSGTLQSAQIAKDALGNPSNIHLIDSSSAIMGQRILVRHAAKMREEGADAAAIAAEVSGLVGRVQVFGILDTLTYLYKGGRLSRTAAFAGNLLRIRPVVTLKDGVVTQVGRGRNFQTVNQKLEELNFDPDFPVYFGYTTDDETCRKMQESAMLQYSGITETGIFPIGSVIGAHVGPGALAISFVTKA